MLSAESDVGCLQIIEDIVGQSFGLCGGDSVEEEVRKTPDGSGKHEGIGGAVIHAVYALVLWIYIGRFQFSGIQVVAGKLDDILSFVDNTEFSAIGIPGDERVVIVGSLEGIAGPIAQHPGS